MPNSYDPVKLVKQLKDLEEGRPDLSSHNETYHGTTPDAAKYILKHGFKIKVSKYGPVVFTTSDRGLALSYGKEKSTPEFSGKRFNQTALIILKKETMEKFGGSNKAYEKHIVYYQDIPPSAIDRIELYKNTDIQKYVDEDNTPDKAKPIKVIKNIK